VLSHTYKEDRDAMYTQQTMNQQQLISSLLLPGRCRGENKYSISLKELLSFHSQMSHISFHHVEAHLESDE
jgi:hypothetical protein